MQLTIETLRESQSIGAYDIMSTLRSIEISVIDVCNRSCSFCPRSLPEYNIKKETASLNMIDKIANELASIAYNGRISFVGTGEPLLYKNLYKAINIIKTKVPTIKWIEVITNGDYLTSDKVKKLDKAGCTSIVVSMYDEDISNKIISMFENIDIDIIFKHLYKKFPIVNRNDIFSMSHELNISRPCYLPFYKMIIDIDGKVIICSNDWKRSGIVGDLYNQTIPEVWTGKKIEEYRSELQYGNRKKCNPCNFCDINGLKYGEDSFNIWRNNERRTDT